MVRGEKKLRDPNRPKRALTGFMFFSKERRPLLTTESPELPFSEVGKRLGQEWKALTPEQKQRFEDQAATDKERYREAMANYSPDPMYAAAASTKSSRRDPNKPKRAMSAYLYFCEAHRSEIKTSSPEKSMIEVQKVLAERWRAADEEERLPFTKQAEVDRARYDAEMLEMAEKAAPVQAAPMPETYIGVAADGY